MKNLLLIIPVCMAIALSSCDTLNNMSPVTKQVVNSGASLALMEGLRFGISDTKERTQVANYADTAAHMLFTLTSSPTSEQLVAMLNKEIPANIRAKYPEIVTLVYPTITSGYQALLDKYGANSPQFFTGLKQLATDIQIGASPFISAPAVPLAR